MNDPFITFRPPPEYQSFIVTFKTGDIHPLAKVPMEGRAVRIYAPGVKEATEVVRHRFGNAFNEMHDESKMRLHIWKNRLYEQLIYKP